ncbi:unnamed protein product [Effrenium voratum]|nr:unnamed protein product [Effrenium voratum]
MRSLDQLLWAMHLLELPREFVLCVLLIWWTENLYDKGEEYDSLEFFSGNSNFTKVMRMSGLKAARFDVLYCSKDRKHNYMDILSSPGLALAILYVIKGNSSCGFLALFAIKCSSWCAVNKGTSHRSACSAEGCLEYTSVCEANVMLERTALLCLLVSCCQGTWLLEQPNGSVLEFYPKWRTVLNNMVAAKGLQAVHRAAWWMHHYGAKTPKRHYAWSTSIAIYRLNRGTLAGWQKRKGNKVVTCRQYKDKKGQRRYTATPALRATEQYPVKFAVALLDLFDDFRRSRSFAEPAGDIPPAVVTFHRVMSKDVGEDWTGANLKPLYEYLRKGKHLAIPPEWKDLIPRQL